MKKVVLAILDGVGLNADSFGNAISLSKSKFLNKCFNQFPCIPLHASGSYVGLPDGQMGNSEVGHCNIGAGRIVPQTLIKINNHIESGDFFENEDLKSMFLSLQEKNATLHLIGLASDGGIHSHISHLFALIDFSQKYSIKKNMSPSIFRW